MTVYLANNRNLRRSIREIFAAFQDSLDLKKGVLLKPNIVFPMSQRSGQITRHAVVRAVVAVLRELDPAVEIILGESTAVGTAAKDNFRVSKYNKLANELSVALLNLDREEHVKLEWKYGTLALPKMAFEKTYISLPILKQSSAATITAAMKNQKGLLLSKDKMKFHKLGLHEPIARLNQLIQPDLSILDCSNFCRGKVLLAGDNTYETDAMASRLIGAPEADHLRHAREIGVGTDDFQIQGADYRDIIIYRRISQKEYQQFLRLRIWSNANTCSMCRQVLSDIKRSPHRNFWNKLIMYRKLLRYALLGAEVVYGSKPQFDKRYRYVICMGNCTKEFAEENGYIHVPGCPPTIEGMAEYF